jgi:hypothetical protein
VRVRGGVGPRHRPRHEHGPGEPEGLPHPSRSE